jgi:RecA-family ATPase
MNGGLTVEMQDVLEQGFLFLPIGHAVYLDTLEGREFYDKALRDNDYTGLILDTLGASVSSSLSDEVTARGVCDWVDHVRKDYGVWVAIIHHPRKAAPGGKTGSRLDDTYGSRIFADRANSVLHLKKGKGDTVELISHKTRLSKTTEFKVLRKSTTLWYDVEETVPVGGESSVKEVSMSFNDNEIKDLPGEGDTDELNG